MRNTNTLVILFPIVCYQRFNVDLSGGAKERYSETFRGQLPGFMPCRCSSIPSWSRVHSHGTRVYWVARLEGRVD